ncbi:hypothetical protein A0H76_353 [Hepatospora eriocheir]|uniref:GOLD domain-containing protein n=1 Tax=Hepatospora eriocheir TaxID=1081669 RepID=A0A1X0QLF7_9MICR|nr:hypothetical protein A0H76_353 [Hepatospora eriocheir]
MILLILNFIKLICGDVFMVKDIQRINFIMQPNNINSGYFKCYGENDSFDVQFIGTDDPSKIYFEQQIDGKDQKKYHFSFNNSGPDKITLLIKGKETNNNHMIFYCSESKIDTFGEKESSELLIKPAIADLRKLLNKLTEVVNSSRESITKSKNLGRDFKTSLSVVVLLSFISLLFYTGFNIAQLVLMKRYLLRKKLL